MEESWKQADGERRGVENFQMLRVYPSRVAIISSSIETFLVILLMFGFDVWLLFSVRSGTVL